MKNFWEESWKCVFEERGIFEKINLFEGKHFDGGEGVRCCLFEPVQGIPLQRILFHRCKKSYTYQK